MARLFPRTGGPREGYYQGQLIPVTALVRAAMAAEVRIKGLTVVNTREKAFAVVRKEGDPWIWLPKRCARVEAEGTVVMLRSTAEAKGLMSRKEG